MQLIAIERDKQNRPVAQVDISTEEIEAIKKAIENHPKFKAEDNEGIRFRALLKKVDWKRLTNINIQDIKEIVNKYRQDMGESFLFTTLYHEFHGVWKTLNPS